MCAGRIGIQNYCSLLVCLYDVHDTEQSLCSDSLKTNFNLRGRDSVRTAQ